MSQRRRRQWLHEIKFDGYVMADFMTMEHTTSRYKRKKEIVIFPKQAELAKRAGVSPDTVVQAISQLSARDHLEIVSRGNQFVGSNRYRILVDAANA